MKLGKLAPKFNKKTLYAAKYLSAAILPDAPEKVYREYKIPDDAWGMFGNDTIGDCTCAAVAHLIMLFTSHTGKLVTPDVSDIIAAYSAITGYDPRQTDSFGNNPTDQGAAITDVLNYWQTSGIAGHKILGWAQIDHTSPLRRAQGVWLFGGLDIGVQLPAIAQEQFSAGQPFEVVNNDGGIEGGHCIVELGYGAEGEDYTTWGRGWQKASSAWPTKYCDEGYVAFTNDWIEEATGLAPNGFDVDALTADLKTIAA